MNKKKVSRFTLMALLLATIPAIAILLSGAIASASLTTGDGGSSSCTLVSKQGPSTTKEVCGEPVCTTTTVQVPQTSSEQVLISAGHYYDCPQSGYVPGYYDYQYPSCYDVTTPNSHTEWNCDPEMWWYCWPVTVQDPPTVSKVCPPPVSVWVPGYTYTYTSSCWADPVYNTQQVTTWVSQQQQSCTPNCQTVTVPGDITYELQCPTPTPVPAPTPTPAPTNCYKDCYCDAQGNCCTGYSPNTDPVCQPKICTAGQEVSQSCSGCKTATVTMCNSYGTATYSLPSQYAGECTSGCPPTPIPTPTPTPAKTCNPGEEVSRSCSSACKAATAKICNSLGTATYDSTVTDNSCTTACATPTPVPKPTPKSGECAKKPKQCGSEYKNGVNYDAVVSWTYNIFIDDCVISTQACAANQQCIGAACVDKAAPTCNIVCSGDTAISWHLANAPGGGQYCAIDSNIDCAAQGKVCEQNKGCVAPTVSAKKDCASLGCPSGYYCSYYGVDLIQPGNTAFV